MKVGLLRRMPGISQTQSRQGLGIFRFGSQATRICTEAWLSCSTDSWHCTPAPTFAT